MQALTISKLLAENKITSNLNETKKGVKRSYDLDDSYQEPSQSFHNDASIKIIRAATASNDSAMDIDVKKSTFKLKENWHYAMSKCVDSSPLLVQSSSSFVKLFIGDHSGLLIALNANTGSSFWEISLELHMENAAAINESGDILYVTAFAGNDVDGFQSKKHPRGLGVLMAINAHDGNVIWSSYTPGEMKQSPVVGENGDIYVGTYDKSLYHFKNDGTLIDKIDCDGSIYSKPAISADGTRIFVATTQGNLFCISIEPTMKIEWKLDVDAPIFASIALSRTDLVVCAAVDGVVRAFTKSSQLVWSAYATRPIFSTPVIAEELKIVLFGSHDGYLRTCSLETGELLFEVDMGSVIYASPFLNTQNNLAIIATTSGDVNIVDIMPKDDSHNSKILSKFRCSGEIYSSPVLYNDNIFVGCRDDRLYSIKIDR